MTTKELKHFGVLGMKWGVRKDKGSTTSQSKKPTNEEMRPAVNQFSLERAYRNALPQPPPTKFEKTKFGVDNAVKYSRELRSNALVNKGLNRQKKEKVRAEQEYNKKVAKKASQMTDQELQKAINRINLERNYVNLNKSDISSGETNAAKYADYAVSALTFLGTAVGIAASVKALRK